MGCNSFDINGHVNLLFWSTKLRVFLLETVWGNSRSSVLNPLHSSSFHKRNQTHSICSAFQREVSKPLSVIYFCRVSLQANRWHWIIISKGNNSLKNPQYGVLQLPGTVETRYFSMFVRYKDPFLGKVYSFRKSSVIWSTQSGSMFRGNNWIGYMKQ